MSIPSDIGGVPNVGDQATRITIQQSLGGAFAGVGAQSRTKSRSPEPNIKLRQSMPNNLNMKVFMML